MSKKFTQDIHESKEKSHFKEIIRIENGQVVTYKNVDGNLVKVEKEEKK